MSPSQHLIIEALLCAGLLLGPIFTAQATKAKPIPFAVSFSYSAEAVNESIEITNTDLTFTHFVDTANRCAQWIAQTPCWKASDLRTDKAVLSVAERDELKSLITSLKFMKLKKTYGGAKKGQRFYARTITVTLEGTSQTVVYQSFPQATPAPEAFSKVEAALTKLVEVKFPKSP